MKQNVVLLFLLQNKNYIIGVGPGFCYMLHTSGHVAVYTIGVGIVHEIHEY